MILEIFKTVTNCAIGIVAVLVIAQMATFFQHWWLLFFIILPLVLCTSRVVTAKENEVCDAEET